jgi:ATP-binding cassette subfamily B protein
VLSRLNNDVIGAQQAFTSTPVRGGLQRDHAVALVVGTMAFLSWTDHRRGVVAAAAVPASRALVAGRKLAASPRPDAAQRRHGRSMTERFGVSGALLVKLFGRPDEEDAAFAAKAAGVRDLGVQIAMSSRVFFSALALVAARPRHRVVYGVGGLFAINGTLSPGELLALAALMGRLYGPLTRCRTSRST